MFFIIPQAKETGKYSIEIVIFPLPQKTGTQQVHLEKDKS